MSQNNHRTFTTINEAFTCIVCEKEIPPANTGCRNHCPYCLSSVHVDINPGDRANPCKGILDCVGYELSKKKGIMLLFKCRKCDASTRNKAIIDGDQVNDDYDLILSKSAKAKDR